MKYERNYMGIPIYSTPVCPKGKLFLINNDKFEIKYPKRKDGGFDMRYSVNKLRNLFNYR